MSTKNSFTLYPSFNLNALERELLYEIWPYRGTFIICPSAYNPISSASISSCVKLHMYIAVRKYGSFGQQFFSMKSISSSQRLTSVYEAWRWMLEVWSLVSFDTRRITTMKVVFGNSGMLTLAILPALSPKSIAGRMLPRLPFFLASRTSLADFFKNTSTHCRRIHSAIENVFNGSQFSKDSKTYATAVSQRRGPSLCCFKRFCPGIMDRCFFSR